MIDNRDCEHCAHHTEQGCSSWSCEFEPRMTEAEIRADERRKFAEWLDKSEKYSLSKVIRCWEDSRYDQNLKVDINEVLSEYEQTKGGQNEG